MSCGYCGAPAVTFVAGRCASCGPQLEVLGAGLPFADAVAAFAAWQTAVPACSPDRNPGNPVDTGGLVMVRLAHHSIERRSVQ